MLGEMVDEIRRFHSFGDGYQLSFSCEGKAVGLGVQSSQHGRLAEASSKLHESDKPSCRNNPNP